MNRLNLSNSYRLYLFASLIEVGVLQSIYCCEHLSVANTCLEKGNCLLHLEEGHCGLQSTAMQVVGN